MKSRTFSSFALIFLLSSTALFSTFAIPGSAYAQNSDLFLKNISRIPGGAVFSSPAGIALDRSGNIYVADYGNYRVAEFNNSGSFIKSYGTSGPGELNATAGVAVDPSGNVYASDSSNNDVVEFSNSGTYVQSFGSTAPGGLSTPYGVAVDSSGNVYVADSGNARVAEFSNSGTYVQSFGSTAPGGLSTPYGVAVDSSGNVYVADSGNARVAEFNSTGGFVRSIGSTAPGSLSFPSSLVLDSSGNVYVADAGNSDVAEFNSTGGFVQSIGSSDPGGLSSPYGVAVDSSGNVYASDSINNDVVEFNNFGGYIQSFGSNENLLLALPSNVALSNNGDIFVADNGNARILVFDNAGNFLYSFGSFGSGNGQFNSPFGIAFDSSDNLYVVDGGNDRVEKFNSTGGFLASFGSAGSSPGQLNGPLGVGVDAGGNVYVADTNNHRIDKFNGAGQYVTSFGSSTLNTPSGVVFNAAGNFYVSDRVNNLVYEFNTTSGQVVNTFPNSNTVGLGSSLNGPYGIGFDFPGNMHIADSKNNRVVVLSGTGVLVNKFGSLGTSNGNFNQPEGLAVDASGNIYVADSVNNRVEIFSPTVPPTTTIIMNSPSSSSVRWGIDRLVLSGHASGLAFGDTVEINWGDGTTTTGIPVSTFTGNWGSVSHTYAASASGQTEEVTASVVSSANSVTATSAAVPIAVLAHHTSITVGSIPATPFGGSIEATGILTDTDANVGISNVPVSFMGSGVSLLPPATTSSGGSYSSTGTAISSILNGLEVTANFTGDSQYLASSSTTVFDTTQHHVALYISPIPSTPWGGNITISGMLNDTDGGNVGVNGEQVAIGGSGMASTQVLTTSTLSGRPGSFLATVASPSLPASGLTVTATFAGDSNYIKNQATTSFSTVYHATTLTLNPISNVPEGSSITATGVLQDADAHSGIVGAGITFNGTGVGTIGGTSTGNGGSYSSQGLSPNSIVSGLSLQAHYAGSVLYQAADSAIQSYSTGGAALISINSPIIIDSLGENQARWGVDPVAINGTVSNAATGDTVTVTWGDSSVTNNVPVNIGKWGPVSHVYGPGAVGTNHVVASLMDANNANVTASPTLSIFVMQHASKLILNPIPNEAVGGPLTVGGRLVDNDTGTGIGGQSVSFVGTGVGSLTAAGTNSTGYFTATGAAPAYQASGLGVKAVYAGDLDILPSNSTVRTYNTVTITSPPEAFNQFDPASKDVVVYGVDATGKIFGPISPQSVTATTWGPDDGRGGDHQRNDDKNHIGDHSKGDDRNPPLIGHPPGDKNHIGDHSKGDDRNPPLIGHPPGDKNHIGDHSKGDDRNPPGGPYYPGNDHDLDGRQAELRTFDIVDVAGNSLVLTEKVVRYQNQADVHVISMQYNNGPVLQAPANLKHFQWSLDRKNNLEHLDQAMIVGRFTLPTIFVHAEYSEGSNQTHIQVTQFGQHPQDFADNGLRLIRMLTDNGSLTVQYPAPQPAAPGIVETHGQGSVSSNASFKFKVQPDSRSNQPEGTLQFDDKSRNISLESVSMQTLSLNSNGSATFTGTATVNGISGYTFSVTTQDRADGSSYQDVFQIEIFDKTGREIYYNPGPVLKGDVEVETLPQQPAPYR